MAQEEQLQQGPEKAAEQARKDRAPLEAALEAERAAAATLRCGSARNAAWLA